LSRVESALVGVDHQVIIVDDNSPDGTWELAQEEATRSVRVVLLKRPGKMGLASAFLDGLARSDGDLIALMDADLQHPPELLPQMLARIDDGADIAIASRFVKGGGVGEWSSARRLVSWGARLMCTLALPRTSGIRDTMSGFFIMRRAIIDGITLSPSSFKILLEVLAKGEYHRVDEVPYIFEPRRKGHSKLGSGEMWNYVKHLVSLSIETKEILTFIRFCLVGLSGVVVNEAIFWALTSHLGVYFVLAGGISAEAAIVSNFTWNDMWTFRAKARGAGAFRRAIRFLRFNISMVGGVLISLVVLYILSTALGISPLISNLFAIVTSMLWNYGASTKLVWR